MVVSVVPGHFKAEKVTMKRFRAYQLIFKSLGIRQSLLFILCNNLNYEREFYARFDRKDFLVRSCTNDLYILNSVLNGDEYADIEAIILNSGYEDLVIDAGAHLGGSAERLRKIFPQNKIVLIEPEKRNFSLLERNVTTLKNKILINAALVPGELMGQELQLKDRTGRSGFTIVQGALDNPYALTIQNVPTISLRKILIDQNAKGIAFLKVDVEGAEKMIFSSDKDLSEIIHVAYIELHDRVVEGCTETVRDFFKNTHKEIVCSGEKLLYVRK